MVIKTGVWEQKTAIYFGGLMIWEKLFNPLGAQLSLQQAGRFCHPRFTCCCVDRWRLFILKVMTLINSSLWLFLSYP